MPNSVAIMFFARSSEIIFADEPTSGLDKRTGKIILDYLKEYVVKGNTVIVASHDEEAYGYATKKHYLQNGEIK